MPSLGLGLGNTLWAYFRFRTSKLVIDYESWTMMDFTVNLIQSTSTDHQLISTVEIRLNRLIRGLYRIQPSLNITVFIKTVQKQIIHDCSHWLFFRKLTIADDEKLSLEKAKMNIFFWITIFSVFCFARKGKSGFQVEFD